MIGQISYYQLDYYVARPSGVGVITAIIPDGPATVYLLLLNPLLTKSRKLQTFRDPQFSAVGAGYILPQCSLRPPFQTRAGYE